jgi:hypothetical protein
MSAQTLGHGAAMGILGVEPLQSLAKKCGGKLTHDQIAAGFRPLITQLPKAILIGVWATISPQLAEAMG